MEVYKLEDPEEENTVLAGVRPLELRNMDTEGKTAPGVRTA